MEIIKNIEGDKLTVEVIGRLDTNTAPELEGVLKESLLDVKELILDFEKLEYISSAGLRVLLATQKTMNQQGTMVVKHVNEIVKEVFDVTGFCDILTIQ